MVVLVVCFGCLLWLVVVLLVVCFGCLVWCCCWLFVLAGVRGGCLVLVLVLLVLGAARVLPEVLAKGMPEATCNFFSDKLDGFKAQVVSSQKVYGLHIINAEAGLTLQALETAVSDVDKEVERLGGVSEAFKKGTGQDIKALAR